MKILVINFTKQRLEYLNVPDEELVNGTEAFLYAHYTDDINWLELEGDSIPIDIRDFNLSNFLWANRIRTIQLRDFTARPSVKDIKEREKQELAAALVEYGNPREYGDEWDFCDEDTRPMIAAYINDEPRDVIVNKVYSDGNGKVTLVVVPKDDCQEIEISSDDVFAGHLEFVTSEIIAIVNEIDHGEEKVSE